MPIVARPVVAPKLFPGVVPKNPGAPIAADVLPYLALDSAEMAPVWEWARNANCGLGFPGYAYLSELTQRSEYRAPAETIASEMTREWIIVKTAGKAGGELDDSPDDLAGEPGSAPTKPKPKAPPPTGDYALADPADAGPDDEEDETDETDTDSDETNATGKPGDADGDEDDELDENGETAEGSGAEDKIEDIVNALDEFGVRDALRKVAELDSFFGRAQILIDIDHGKGAELVDEVRKLPLVVSPETIKKGSLKGFRVVEPIWTTPYSYNASDPTAPDFYKPRAWFVLGKMIHSSRLLTFVSREVPDLLKPAYNFGGMALSQLMEPYVYQWLRTRNAVSDLIHNFSIVALKTNMAALLEGATGAGKGLLDRATLFTKNRDNQGLMLLDKETEELEQHAVPLSGLDALQAQAQEHMAAPSHIPLVKLLGITPTGLNASSEGEIKVFYDYVRALQQSFFAEHLKTIIEVIQLHLFGRIDDAITFEFVPLTSPSVKELSEMRKSDAESGVRYIEAGVIDPAEERERLMADPNSGYTNLAGPPPEPPPMDVNPLTGEPEGGPGSLVPGAGKPPGNGKPPGAEEPDDTDE
jgi:phage-related protein (TIGR01555 family)